MQSRIRAESRARYYIREEAKNRGWNTGHVSKGGDVLEENEISAHFKDIGLGLEKPDFLLCLGGEPVVVIEAKNEAGKVQDAVDQATEYADLINATNKYKIKIVVGAAGEPDTGFVVAVKYLSSDGWVPLKSMGFEITNVPSIREAELALGANDGTTTVSVPDSHEFIDAAVKISSLLRTAKVEAPLRPKVIGAIVLAMYQAAMNNGVVDSLASVNAFAEQAVTASIDISEQKKQKLIDALRLSGSDFDRLAPTITRVVSILRRLNVRSVLQTDTDFLGMFYEAFLRYGYDNNALGIVFTPRHITRFCVELIGVAPTDKVIDLTSGTGGFLVAAFDIMMAAAMSDASKNKIKSSLFGFDTNPTVWALATLNMFFRGDGKSHIELGNCLDAANRASVLGEFSRAFLNPPFSQEGEPERDFINATMDALQPEGILAAVVKAGIFADEDHKSWRKEFLRRHTLLAMISLPEMLFYPTTVPTSIIVTRAHVPQSDTESTLMARVWNDGFEELKTRRIEREGNQLPEIKAVFGEFMAGRALTSPLATQILGSSLKDGAEWSPQQWLPQPHATVEENTLQQKGVLQSVYRAVAQFPDLADVALLKFSNSWSDKPSLPLSVRGPITNFFEVYNGNSAGESSFSDGPFPYVSSGDTTNSIVRLISPIETELFKNGGLTVTAFGTACLQPWPFLARGNGGSAVRVLLPKFDMSCRELVWFASQINFHRWRIFYARMAIKSRIERLEIESPSLRLPDGKFNIARDIKKFRGSLEKYSELPK